MSCEHLVLKFYKQSETNAFVDEVNRNSVLIASSHLQKSIMHVSARLDMPPVHLDGQVYDFYSYILIPYCSKATLIDLIMNARQKGVWLTLELVLYLSKTVLENLQYLHEINELAHLDIKPDNIVLTDTYRTSLIDFGHVNWIKQTLNH